MDPELRIRTTLAYVASIALHGILAALFVIQPTQSNATAEISGSSEQVTMERSSPNHAARPPELPRATKLPVVVVAPHKAVPRPRELSVIVPSAPPLPTPLPQASPLPVVPLTPVAVPSVAVVAMEITPRPTIAPTSEPSVAPTAFPTTAPTVAPSAAPSVAPSAAPSARPTIVPKPVATHEPHPASAPSSAPSAAPHPAATPGSHPSAHATPGSAPHTLGATSPVAQPNVISVPPTPRPQPRRTPRPRPTAGTPGNLAGLIPHIAVTPQTLKRYGANYGAMSAGYQPTPPPDVRAQTRYIYRTSGVDTLEMWVTSVTRGALASRCHGWLVRFPHGPPSQAGPPSRLAPTVIFGGGGGPTQAGRAVDPIIVGMVTIPCRAGALTPFTP